MMEPCMHGIDTSRKVCKDCDMLDEDIAKVKEFQAKMPELLDMYKVSPPRCTCITDKEMTCIVHPTERALKARIAELDAALADMEKQYMEEKIEGDRLEAENRRLREQSLLRKVGEPLPAGCYCTPGKCAAPKPNWCRDFNKRDALLGEKV